MREPELPTVPPISEEELVHRWQELNDELNQKKEQLEDLLRGQVSQVRSSERTSFTGKIF
jgi:CHASE3 domain sensor protein